MVKGSVITFYRSCNKPTFWFACVVLWQLMAFLPSMPSMVLYGVYIAYALYVLFHSSNLTFYKPLLVFLLYVPVQLMLVAPDSSFHCWTGLFCLSCFLFVYRHCLTICDWQRTAEPFLESLLQYAPFLGSVLSSLGFWVSIMERQEP